jgi:O-antigen/teichoic acid export membrane protein
MFCLNIGFAAMANPFINALNAMGKINTTLKLMMIMTGATWGLTPIFWFKFGFVGVAIVAALVAAISLFSVVLFSQHTRVHVIKHIWVTLASSVVMAGVIALSRFYLTPTLPTLVLQVVVGAGVYLLCLMVLGRKQMFAQLHHVFPKWI